MSSSLQQFLELFDLDFDTVEEKVSNQTGAYKGLSAEALYTSSEDLLNIFRHPLVQGSFLDLGCGEGRASIIYGYLFPGRQSVGIEFEQPRYDSGQRHLDKLSLDNVTLIHADLLETPIPQADVYFLYFPTGRVLDKVLSELYSNQEPFKLIAIESHGDLISRLNLENWLTLRAKVPLHSKRHHSEAHIYQRNQQKRDQDLKPFELSYVERFLFIRGHDEVWIGETSGMEWTQGDRFELLTPPRTIYWQDVQNIAAFAQIDKKYHEAIKIRRLGELHIRTSLRDYHAFIRKIIVSPTFHLELSGGEKVEWIEILTIQQGSITCYSSL